MNDGKTTKVYIFNLTGTSSDPIESSKATNPPKKSN